MSLIKMINEKIDLMFLLLVLLVITACEKSNKLSKAPPEIPIQLEYDLNDDLIDDFTINYKWFTWDGANVSGDEIFGIIEPLGQNSILFKRSHRALFNQLNDTIKKEVAEPLYWESFQADLVSISNSSDNDFLWPKEWEINSNENQATYYLGVKIKVNDGYLLGWLKLKIDKTNGEIDVLDKKLTTNDFIIIK